MNEKVKFGYLVPTRDAVMRAPDGRADIDRMLDLAVLSERMGFASIWLGDSILARPRFEALTTLAAIASRTSRAQLGTAVYLTPLRHPVPLAHMIGNLDLLSGGRLLFGIGLGTQSPAVMAEYAACSVNYRQRGRLLEEGLQIMKGLWSGHPFSFHGRLFDVKDVLLHPLPGCPGGPPVLMAAGADAALQRLAKFADGWLPICPNAAAFASDWEKIQETCSKVGRDYKKLLRVLYITLNVNPDEAEAERGMEDFLIAYYGPVHWKVKKFQGLCAGSPERCATFLKEFIDAGVSHFVVRFAAHEQEPQMERFLGEIAPLLT